jgi:hypothetical protein
MLRDQVTDTPTLLGRGAALMVITWSLLETGQWDDALEYAGRARTLTAIYHEPVVRTSVITAAAYIAACRGHSAAATEDAMSALGVSGLTARSAMTAKANHAMGMAALVQDRTDEAFDWLRQLFGLIDLAEAARRTGRRAEASPTGATQPEASTWFVPVSGRARSGSTTIYTLCIMNACR